MRKSKTKTAALALTLCLTSPRVGGLPFAIASATGSTLTVGREFNVILFSFSPRVMIGTFEVVPGIVRYWQGGAGPKFQRQRKEDI
jgi:hypothetical protein